MDSSGITINHPRIKLLVEQLDALLDTETDAIDTLQSEMTAAEADIDDLEALNQDGTDGSYNALVAVATYDFSADGGTAGDIDLGIDLPANAFVTKVSWHEVTAIDSADDTGTLLLKAGSTALNTAIAVGDGDGTESTVSLPIYFAAASDVKVTIGVQDLTAGKVKFFIEYTISEAEA